MYICTHITVNIFCLNDPVIQLLYVSVNIYVFWLYSFTALIRLLVLLWNKLEIMYVYCKNFWAHFCSIGPLYIQNVIYIYFPGCSVVKNPPANAGDAGDRFNPWVVKISWRREWLPVSVFWPGEFQGQMSLAGYSPWDHKELNATKWLTQCIIFECLLWTTH